MLGSVLFASCGGGGGDSSASSSSVSGGTADAPNVVAITVGAGPNGYNNINIPYVNVTVCQPATATCATIDHILLDTGSWGLRLMASAVAAQGLNLPWELDASGNTIGECLSFAGGYAWGPVATADVILASERAGNAPIQIIDDTGSSFANMVPASCSGHPPSLNSVGSFDSNGILGVGVRISDCGSICELRAANGYYFSCNANTSSCQGTILNAAQQVTNPVALFSVDNNGVIVELPAVPATGVAAASGSLIFGIGTQSNNAFGAGVVLGTDEAGNMLTEYKGSMFGASIIDSGSNAFDFPDGSIPACPNNYQGFYCPASTLGLQALNEGQNGVTNTVNFEIENIATVRARNSSGYAFSDVGAALVNNRLSGSFVWGLPFFFGKSVYTAITGRPTPAPAGQGPYYAY